MDEGVISLEDIFYSLKKRWKMICIISILTTLVAGLYSKFTYVPYYQSTAKLFIGKEKVQDYGSSASEALVYQKYMKTYAEIIKTPETIKKALALIEKDVSDGNIARVNSGISVTSNEESQILNISYISTNIDEVTEILEAVSNAFMSESKEILLDANIKLIQPARKPLVPIGNNNIRNTILGFLLGIMISVGIIFLLEYLDNTVKKSEDLEKILEAPVLVVIPDFNRREKRKYKKNRKRGLGGKANVCGEV